MGPQKNMARLRNKKAPELGSFERHRNQHKIGAGEGNRTLYIQLGKLTFYR